jgi:serine protease Do
MVFFLSPDERVYARYGGRTDDSPDERQSLAGLRYTMESVLAEHASENPRFAPTQPGEPFTIHDVASRGFGGCIHCHQTKEILYNRLELDGHWSTDLAFRYPLPDNLGLLLEVDRGNVVDKVVADSPAAAAGLQTGDVIETLNGVPIHSQGDAQFALDRAPKTGQVEVAWRRGDGVGSGSIELPEDWRRSNIRWRASLQYLISSPRLFGENLTVEEKQALGLGPRQLAFRQQDFVAEQARNAGVQAGDIILGVNDEHLEMRVYDFIKWFRGRYVKGETVTVNVLRDGEPLRLPMTLQ